MLSSHRMISAKDELTNLLVDITYLDNIKITLRYKTISEKAMHFAT